MAHLAFRLPNLAEPCRQFPLTYHKNGDAIAAASEKWFESGCSDFTEEKRRHLYGLKAGQLSAYVYHDSDDEHLRVVCDFMNFLFHMDDLSDGLVTRGTEMLTNIVMNALSFPQAYHPIHGTKKHEEEESDVSRLARNFWARCLQDAGRGMQARFCENLWLYFQAVGTQARDRDNGTTPELNSYITDRRDNSGVKPLMDILEYSLCIDLPEFVIKDPVIEALKQGTNDFVAWSNDIFSYNIEQARGDTYNMVAILMEHEGLGLQTAVDYIGEMCRVTIDTFCENKKKIPSWGPEIDGDVSRYVHGLENWIAGSLHWSFLSERYFGPKPIDIKNDSIITLTPRQLQAIAA